MSRVHPSQLTIDGSPAPRPSKNLLGELVASQVSAENKGGQIKLMGLTYSLRELLTLTRLLAAFDVYENEADAIQSFAARLTNAEKTPLAFA